MEQIVEIVPNISEGRNLQVIELIKSSMTAVAGVRVVHTDIGYSANRTVFTVFGNKEAIAQAAFCLVESAYKHIDMQQHSGTHPRLGAVDVLPFVPVRNITLEECAKLAHDVAQRIANELNISSYCYEAAAINPKYAKLEQVRHGEYEGLPCRLTHSDEQPDFGPAEFNPRFGALIIGARNFLIAYNVNLQTNDVAIAKKIAGLIRESGTKNKSGLLTNLKAIGWYVDEYNCAQVSCNLTDFKQTSVKTVFDTICNLALAEGVSVNGSELIGLIPTDALIEGFESNDKKQSIHAAIEYLGLNVCYPFVPENKIVEAFLA
jgi:glutamate formiminotransferase/formiminotetrahydrofolate cyclodeaminase